MSKQWHQLEKLDHKSLKKVQQDREKAVKDQQAAGERKKILIYIGAFLFCVVCGVIFLVIVRNKQAEQARTNLRKKMLSSVVQDVKGRVMKRDLGDWEPVKKGLVIEKEMTFKTEADGILIVHLNHGGVLAGEENPNVAGNLLKLHPNSEFVLQTPKLDEITNRVQAEEGRLTKGELTVEISQAGRELLRLIVGPATTRGLMGRYKLIYDNAKTNGEIVVKNGLVEVGKVSGGGKPVNVTGFYKIILKGDKVGNPEQAAVINYNWM